MLCCQDTRCWPCTVQCTLFPAIISGFESNPIHGGGRPFFARPCCHLAVDQAFIGTIARVTCDAGTYIDGAFTAPLLAPFSQFEFFLNRRGLAWSPGTRVYCHVRWALSSIAEVATCVKMPSWYLLAWYGCRERAGDVPWKWRCRVRCSLGPTIHGEQPHAEVLKVPGSVQDVL